MAMKHIGGSDIHECYYLSTDPRKKFLKMKAYQSKMSHTLIFGVQWQQQPVASSRLEVLNRSEGYPQSHVVLYLAKKEWLCVWRNS